ncbi:MAG: HD domain-containing protein [Planctomycetaceae bacterium]|jgi:tRNA nucleotidyltransferase (CCA-adding enzyme)|nr:HD domain-containing protein [Planctomycetaceae bacterium]
MFLLEHQKSQTIMNLLRQSGATDVLFVGGCVRDVLLGVSKIIDIDIEVYGLDYDKIVEILSPHFRVGLVGKSFGTVKVGHGIDISIPRRESKSGVGHKGFQIYTDPMLTFREAALRRDFTVNAIGMRQDGTLVDPYDGAGDICRKILRATSNAFSEDPLRVLRAMQFAARFDFVVEERTVRLCRTLKSEFPTLSKERVWGEWYKWGAKSQIPSRGLECLKATEWIDCFPQIAHLIGVPQHPAYHQEGDVFEHTKMTVDAAAELAKRECLPENQRLILLFAALLHDIGKPQTLMQHEEGHWTSPGHPAAGVKPAKEFLESMLAPHWVIAQVLPLITEHQTRLQGDTIDVTRSATRRLAFRLAPATIRMWGLLCESDAAGCISERKHPPLNPRLEMAKQLGVLDGPPKPIIQGRHLMEKGMEPGPEMGIFLRKIFEAQLDGAFIDIESGLKWLESEFQL